MNWIEEQAYNIADVECNGKYDNDLPYSFHIKKVLAQGRKFYHLIAQYDRDMSRGDPDVHLSVVDCAILFHDHIEDFRMTYNDILHLVWKGTHCSKDLAIMVADIVYCVTDEKGKTRSDRKNLKYYQELKANKLALFVKLADLAANTLYSKLSASDMYDKYKKEWPAFKNKLYLAEYDEFFNYIDNI